MLPECLPDGHPHTVCFFFFFCLKHRNGQRKIVHCLRSEDGSTFTETTDIRRYSTQFFKGLFHTELVEDPELDTSFLSDLPQGEASTNSQLDAELAVEELHVALMSLANGKSPDVDRIPVDYLWIPVNFSGRYGVRTCWRCSKTAFRVGIYL